MAEEAGRGFFEWEILFLGGVRRVIRGDEIEHAASESVPHSVPIPTRSKRRIHPVKPVERRDELVGEREMMRRRVGGNVALPLEEADEGRRKFGAHVGDVSLRPRLGGEDEARRRRDVLRARGDAGESGERGVRPVVNHTRRERVILAVEDHRKPGGLRIKHRIPQNPRRLRPESIVRDAKCPSLFEKPHLRESLTLQSDVERGGDIRPYPRLL